MIERPLGHWPSRGNLSSEAISAAIVEDREMQAPSTAVIRAFVGPKNSENRYCREDIDE